MPARIPPPVWQCLRAPTTSSPHVTRSFSSSPSSLASTVKQKRRRHDPYAASQAAARKAANLSRQEVLKKQRAAALGDPVRGVTTPFLESFDTALPPAQSAASSQFHSLPEKGDNLNFLLTKDELEAAVENTRWLNTPEQRINTSADIETPEEKERAVRRKQENAEEALRRLSDLSLGSNKDRHRANTQRIIEVFGRHNTDETLPPRPLGAAAGLNDQNTKLPRAGPDTGSSEVQIAVLTAKIRKLADFLQTRGAKDAHNHRNLRLLVHRRQKLLRYLQRKERGGPRWQHLIETLGLTEGTWKGEISM